MNTQAAPRTITREQLSAAKAKLIAAGWQQTHSVMHDGGGTGNFGVCFIRVKPTLCGFDRERFYLNVDTFDRLPA